MLKAPPQPADTARTAAQNVGHLQPRQRPTQPPQDHLVHAHRSLPGLRCEGHRHLLDGDMLRPRPPVRAVMSCAPPERPYDVLATLSDWHLADGRADPLCCPARTRDMATQ